MCEKRRVVWGSWGGWRWCRVGLERRLRGKAVVDRGKAWGAWYCVAVWVGERWFALIGRGRVVVALVFARQSVVRGAFLFVCATHAERKH